MFALLVVGWLIGGAICGFAAGTIRENQGGSFGGGFAWGFFLGLIGLVVVIATKPRPPVTSAASPTAVRECPFCKEAMRRDASVCPHCRHESAPWRFWEGRWWTPAETDPPQWYDEYASRWRPSSEIPHAEADRFDVVVTALPEPGNVTAVARIVAGTTGEGLSEIADRLNNLPATVVDAASYSTAEGVRSALTRGGTSAELRPYADAPTVPPALAGDSQSV